MNDQHEPTPTEARRAKEAKRERFLEWCKEHREDPEDEGAWDDMSDDDRAGWTDNMNKE